MGDAHGEVSSGGRSPDQREYYLLTFVTITGLRMGYAKGKKSAILAPLASIIDRRVPPRFMAKSQKKSGKKKGRKSAKRGKARTPAVRHLRYLLSHTGQNAEDSHYLDLARDLSAINGRLYRQGRYYHVKRATVHSTTADAFVKFATIPDTWVSKAAWKRGKDAWTKMRKTAEVPSARWADYKVYLNSDMKTDPDRPLAVDTDANSVQIGEWEYSDYYSPDGTAGFDAFTAHMMGAHSGGAGIRDSIGLIESYGDTRRVSSPTTVVDSEGDDDPLVNLFDAGTHIDELAADKVQDNSFPPYAWLNQAISDIGEHFIGASSNMPAPQVVAETQLTTTTGLGVVGGMVVPLGLLEIETRSAQDGDVIEVLVELEAGSYQGVKSAAYA